MDKKEIFDATFDPDRSETYILSVQVSSLGVSFCINDTVRGMHIAYVSYPFGNSLSPTDDWNENLEQLFLKYDILKRTYKKVLFSYESNLFTSVPTELFMAEKAKELFELVHPLPNLFEIRYNHLKDVKATVVFAIPYSLSSKWLTYQPKTDFIGYSSTLITYSCLLKNHKDEPIVNAIFSDGFFITIISVNGELKHCNSFNFVNVNDASYYMLNFTKQAGLSTNRLVMSFVGELDDVKSFESIMAQYFGKVCNGFSIDSNNYSYAITEVKKVNWNLFNMLLCE